MGVDLVDLLQEIVEFLLVTLLLGFLLLKSLRELLNGGVEYFDVLLVETSLGLLVVEQF